MEIKLEVGSVASPGKIDPILIAYFTMVARDTSGRHGYLSIFCLTITEQLPFLA